MQIFKQKWAKFKEQEPFTFILASLQIHEMTEKVYGKNG